MLPCWYLLLINITCILYKVRVKLFRKANSKIKIISLKYIC